ncbi:cobyrinate a,c-diamide synthase [Desulfuribacillus alkaliarsenatis]|uniref:Cobyrinate a,c-diamide synthase n=1 Tax=Desulfuribacillus alkaliarsenatis TaxID=766136 RepID=A0A1E5G5N0_9FIRM|nr:cobyrinate a,c-diamide synthase [Desulfuribacillus alkaliarsenatis]OEF97999.1 hypothetical protein BHF68_13115 [Desulfuribacillus alkaliarsenatis]
MGSQLLIAGVQSGAGKTTLTLGIMAALKRRGLTIQPFKVGPDYIDPGLHYHAAGTRSHNLDSWMGSEQVVKDLYAKHTQQADVAIIEGVMGLFDGAKHERLLGSSAHIAMILDIPVVLVVNVKGMGRSCLALIKGFSEYEPQLRIKGVILNNAGSDYYKSFIKKEIEQELGVKVIGCLSKNDDIRMPERHLGLLPAEENQELAAAISKMADMVEAEINLDELLAVGRQAQHNQNYNHKEYETIRSTDGIEAKKLEKVKIGVAKDEAFSFYYQDSLDFLEELGAELHYFSPLRDAKLPDVDGLYIGGGFPEMFLEQLADNRSMVDSIKLMADSGIPIFAECGGYMYLAESIRDREGRSWNGVGIVPIQIEMTKRLVALGYVQATALQDSLIAGAGELLRGHEFHYSKIIPTKRVQAEQGSLDADTGLKAHAAFSLVGGKGAAGRLEGYSKGNICASYLHLHLRSNPKAVTRLLVACRAYKRGGMK